MTGLDVSHLGPGDAAAALRSYPRRFREVLMSVDPDELPHEALEHADHVARAVAMLGEALRQVVVQDAPVLHPATMDDAGRHWAFDNASSVDDVLQFLAMECNALADAIDDVVADQWTRRGTIAGTGQDVTALDIAREAVRTGSDHLHAAERTISRQ